MTMIQWRCRLFWASLALVKILSHPNRIVQEQPNHQPPCHHAYLRFHLSLSLSLPIDRCLPNDNISATQYRTTILFYGAQSNNAIFFLDSLSSENVILCKYSRHMVHLCIDGLAVNRARSNKLAQYYLSKVKEASDNIFCLSFCRCVDIISFLLIFFFLVLCSPDGDKQ